MSKKDHFKDKAREWDRSSRRVQGALKIANAIHDRFVMDKDMQIMDFGTGTGLLGFEIARFVQKVYGVDTSKEMIEQLKEKNTSELSLETYHRDIIKEPIDKEFDGIVSSMTLHHIKDLELFFQTIYKNTKKGGFIAIADLEKEDGTFHSNNDGVHHFGFEEDKLCNIVKFAGFNDVKFENINTIKKEQEYGIFLLSAIK